MLLEIKDFSVFYNNVAAVKNINIDVAENEFVTILGSNGAGKTSTLNAISGIVKFKGEIWFQGSRIDRLSPPQIAAKGIIHIPEGGGIFPMLSVMDNLRMGAYLQKDKSHFARSLESVFNIFPILKERRTKRGDSLSGGERQMLALGRALMAKPRLLLMDEPTLGLSPALCKKVEAQVAKINQDKIAILFVAQNARMALRLSSRGYVLEKGELILEGPSPELMRSEKVKKAYLGI